MRGTERLYSCINDVNLCFFDNHLNQTMSQPRMVHFSFKQVFIKPEKGS